MLLEEKVPLIPCIIDVEDVPRVKSAHLADAAAIVGSARRIFNKAALRNP